MRSVQSVHWFNPASQIEGSKIINFSSYNADIFGYRHGTQEPGSNLSSALPIVSPFVGSMEGKRKKEEPKVYRGQSTPNLLPNDTCRYFYYWPTDPPRYNNTIRRVKSEKDGGECNVECSVVFIGGKFKDRNNNCRCLLKSQLSLSAF